MEWDEPLALTASSLKPPGRIGHIVVTYENYMFVWGGYRENPGVTNTYFPGSELWIYSSLSEKWYLKVSPGNDGPPGMSGATAVIIEDSLYLFGGYGYNYHGCTNSLYKMDLQTFVWENLSPSGSKPSPVDKMVGWQYNDKMYIFGGFGSPDDGGGAFDFQFVIYHLFWRGWTNQFFEYDPKKNCWRRPSCVGSLPSARAAHAATMVQDKVYIFGGRHDTVRLNDLHCLDMTTMTWSGEIKVNGPLPEGRSWHSLTAVSDRLILYGGFSQHNVALSDCWMYDTRQNIWFPVELPFRKPRLWHAACLNNFNEVVIYGGCTCNILDHDRIPEQTNDVIVIRISPKSLYRLCIDHLMTSTRLRPYWSTLPRSILSTLHLRFESFFTSNLDGS